MTTGPPRTTRDVLDRGFRVSDVVVGMRERAESLGGHLDAGSTPDRRFRVSAVVPHYRHRA